jgi:uncharacterized protein (DUF697 family)
VRAIFGVVSLLVVLAIVGFVASRQFKAVAPLPATASGVTAVAPAEAGSASAREQAQQLQQKVREDVAKALEQAAQNNARAEEASK